MSLANRCNISAVCLEVLAPLELIRRFPRRADSRQFARSVCTPLFCNPLFCTPLFCTPLFCSPLFHNPLFRGSHRPAAKPSSPTSRIENIMMNFANRHRIPPAKQLFHCFDRSRPKRDRTLQDQGRGRGLYCGDEQSRFASYSTGCLSSDSSRC